MAFCPTCERQFSEAGGFCPYDRTRLEATTPPPTQRGHGSGPVVRAISAKTGGSAAALAELQSGGDDEYDRLVGTTLDGRYTIERKLGEGGMGVVFLGKHTVIEKPVAIKVLKREVARDHSTVKRFVQEAKAASRIGHPNIVDVTDFGTTDDGLTYSVMEFVEGATLGKVIRDQAPLETARALHIAVQIARALGAAHDKGIVHRDLKPENAFLQERAGRTDFVKIVDFGIAKVTPLDGNAEKSRLTRAGTVFGTPEYMAPEQAAGKTDTDQRVDIYALGIIIYEMLTGKVPHKADSLVRTLAMQMLDPIIPPRQMRAELDISDALEAVIMKALAKKREERFQTMAELIDAVEQVSGGVPIEQPRSPSSAAQRLPGGKVLGGRSAPDARTMVPKTPPGMVVGGAADRETLRGEHSPTPEPAADRPTIHEQPAAPKKKRSKLEPAFVDRKRPLTLDVLDDDEDTRTGGSRWPLVLGILLLFGAGGAAAAYLAGRGDDAAVAEASDAGVLALVPADAHVMEIPLDDAGIAAASPDAGRRMTGNGNHGGKTPGNTTVVRPGRSLDVQIITRPDNATLYIDGDYSGTGNVTVTRTEGTRATVRCTLPGHQAGSVEVVFDGINEVYLCKPQRKGKCIKDLKNPFDDCPE